MTAPTEEQTAFGSLSDHDNDFLARSITERATRLEKMGKQAETEGYNREAKRIKGDAAYARDELLTRFEPQLKAFEKTEAEAKAGAANIIFDLVKRAELLKTQPGQLADQIAERVIAYGIEVYTAAYAAGVADRRDYSQPAILINSLRGLRGETEKSEE